MRKTVLFLVVMLTLIATTVCLAATDRLVLESTRFVRMDGAPVTQTVTFDGVSAPATIRLVNGDLEDSSVEKVSSSVILLNGVTVFSSEDFSQNVYSLEKDVALSIGPNTLSVTLKGKPGGVVSLSILAHIPNTPPTAEDSAVSGTEDESIPVTILASDEDGDPLTLVVVTPPTNGALSGTYPDVVYTPAMDYFGEDSFTFYVTDGWENSNLASVSISVASAPEIWFVDADNDWAASGGVLDGRSWQTAFLHPQDGLDVADPGDQVWVAEGTYGSMAPSDPSRPVVAMKEGVQVFGGFAGTEENLSERVTGAHPTLLDGAATVHHVVVGASDSTLDGFKICNGRAVGVHGGGIYNESVSSLVVRNCSFQDNAAVLSGGVGGAGAGMMNLASDVQVYDCDFTGNRTSAEYAYYTGGGAVASVDNSYLYVENSQFLGNVGNSGGAARISSGSHALFVNCVFRENEAYNGSALEADYASLEVRNSLLASNKAWHTGALYLHESSSTILNSTVANNVAALSYGGGIANVLTSSFSIVRNSILYGNSFNDFADIFGAHGSVVTNTDIGSGWTGSGNISANPSFTSDYHLMDNSPCIDAGSNAEVPADLLFDLGGNDRILDGNGDGTSTVDMGAFEHGGETYPPVTGILYFPGDDRDAEGKVSDLNGDGRGDVIYVDHWGGQKLLVSMATGGPELAFTTTAYPLPIYPRVLDVGDFNGDGHPDVCIGGGWYPGYMRVYLNNGAGGLLPPTDYGTGFVPYGIVTTDLNGDGFLDIITSNHWQGPYDGRNGTLSVFVGRGDGTFDPGVLYPAGDGPGDIIAGDFDGDGLVDLVIGANDYDAFYPVSVDNIRFFHGNGDGTVASYVVSRGLGTNGALSLLGTDIEGDGDLDVIVSGTSGQIYFMKNDGTGAFTLDETIISGSSIATVTDQPFDFNGDGYNDFAAGTTSSFVSIFFGTGTGFTETRIPCSAGDSYNFSIEVAGGDVDGDGLPDVVAPRAGGGFLIILSE